MKSRREMERLHELALDEDLDRYEVQYLRRIYLADLPGELVLTPPPPERRAVDPSALPLVSDSLNLRFETDGPAGPLFSGEQDAW